MAVDHASLKAAKPEELTNVSLLWTIAAAMMEESKTSADGDIVASMNEGAWRGIAARVASSQLGTYTAQLEAAAIEARAIARSLSAAYEPLSRAKSQLQAAIDRAAEHPYLEMGDDGEISVVPSQALTRLSEAGPAAFQRISQDMEEIGVARDRAIAAAQLVDVELAEALYGVTDYESGTRAFNPEAGEHTLDPENLDTIIDEIPNETSDQSVTRSLLGLDVELNPVEAEIVDEMSTDDKISLGIMREYSEKRATELYEEFENGKTDAFRHTLWNAMMAGGFGDDFAERLATAHEMAPAGTERELGSPPIENVMDLHNNEVGRRLIAENDVADMDELEDLIQQAMRDGELLIVHDGQLVPSDSVSTEDPPDSNYTYPTK